MSKKRKRVCDKISIIVDFMNIFFSTIHTKIQYNTKHHNKKLDNHDYHLI